MKRQPTPEQKEKAEQRRAQFREIAQSIAQLTPEQRAELSSKYLVTTCEGHTLSLTNQMLIALQMDNPTIVGGFNQWHAAGRTVKRGEHGLMIWIPKTKKEEAGQPEYFFMGYVFDVSQTEAIQC